MATRIRRTAKQIADDLEARARVARTRARKVESAQETRAAIIAGKTIRGMVDAGDVEATRVWDKMLAGLKRDQDRRVFGLPLLPAAADATPAPVSAPVAQPAPAAPPVPRPTPSDRAADLSNRLDRAVAAHKAGPTVETAAALAAVVVEFETITGKLFSGIQPEHRVGFGLGPGPAERLKAS